MNDKINGIIVSNKVYVIGEIGKDCRYCDLCDTNGKCTAPWFAECGFDDNDCGRIYNFSQGLTDKLNGK